MIQGAPFFADPGLPSRCLIFASILALPLMFKVVTPMRVHIAGALPPLLPTTVRGLNYIGEKTYSKPFVQSSTRVCQHRRVHTYHRYIRTVPVVFVVV